MGILDHELQKYAIWVDELDKKRREYGEHGPEFKSSETKFNVLVRKQEQLFRGMPTHQR